MNESGEQVRFSVQNIGGITETTVSLAPGVTVLTGTNATNRTSFLQSIMAALGSDNATLKGDASEGRVRMDVGGETYERTLKRSDGTVRFDGTPYLDDEAGDVFAFLLENNEARRAVALGDDLRDIIMSPVDTEQLRRDIRQLESAKDGITDKIAANESKVQELSELETNRQQIQDEIATKKAKLAEKEDEIGAYTEDIPASRDKQATLETKLEALQETRGELQSVRQRIQREKRSVSSLKREQSKLENRLAELPDGQTADERDHRERIATLRTRRQRLNTELSELQNLIQYNNDQLEDGSANVLQPTARERSNGESVTAELRGPDSASVVCWTCGSTVERDQIAETIDRLESLRSEKASELTELKSTLDRLKSEQRERERARDRREELRTQLTEIREETEQREQRIASLKQQRESLTVEIADIESAVEELESDGFERSLSLHRAANELEFEIDQLESDLGDVEDEIEERETLKAQTEELRAERKQIAERLTDKRTKVAQIEADAVDAFNEHMAAILELLGYGNLDRIWIERVEQTVRDGREKVEATAFELHVVRTTPNGVGYEDSVDHLSESEREVTGLVFALAGYLVHDLHETVPFILLDSLEAIDSERIATLVDYISEYARYLVVALLPEDSQALDSNYARVCEI